MNIKIGAVSSIVNLLAVLGFATSMLLHFNFGSYLCSMFIAFSFDLLGYALMTRYSYVRFYHCSLRTGRILH